MVDQLIAGAEDLIGARVSYAQANGLSPRVGAAYRAPSAPWRFVAHTMEAPEDDPSTPNLDEGWDLGQLRGYIIRHRTPPHLWAAPEHDWVGQTVPLTLASYALRHESGDPETNHARAIQLELIGYARDDPYVEYAGWVGERIIRPLLAAGVPINVRRWAPSDGSAAYGTGGSVRMSWDAWASFDGICGHQNVPGNSHWDPGRARYDLMVPTAPGDDNDMGTLESIAPGAQEALSLIIQDAVMRAVGRVDGVDGVAMEAVRKRAAEGVNLALKTGGSDARVAVHELASRAVREVGLAGMTPEAIAAAIPDDLVAGVVAVLAHR